MRPHDGGVEHLNQVRGAAGCSEGVEEGLENARLAQAPEALPDGIPVPECLGQRPPWDVMDREVGNGLEEETVVAALVARAASAPPGTPQLRSPSPHPSSASAWSASSNRPGRNQKSGDWGTSPRIILVAIRPHGLGILVLPRGAYTRFWEPTHLGHRQ